MSAETKARLQRAIDAHMADESPEDITGTWALLVELSNLQAIEDDQYGWWMETHGNRFTVTGLLQEALWMGANDTKEDNE